MHCPVCHHPQKENNTPSLIYTTTHPLFASCRIVSCEDCKSGWVSNPPSVEALKRYYGKGAYGDLGTLDKPDVTLERCQAWSRWNFIIQHLGRYQRDIGNQMISVCDIGAGYGCTLEVGRYRGFPLHYFAYESSPSMRKRIQRLGGRVLEDFFAHQWVEQFDLVWASHLLEHYANPDEFLERMRKMMKPNGVGFIEIPSLDYEFKPNFDPHLLFCTQEGLKKALERNGFKVLEINSVGKLREEANKNYPQIQNNSYKVWLKEILPKPVAWAMRFLYGALKGNIFKKEINLTKDLDRKDVFQKWDLETYGGERCWIRTAFILEPH